MTCERGTAPLNVTFAEFSAYKDPSAPSIELVAYTLTAQTVTAINAQLAIGPAGSVTAVPTQTLEATVTAPNTPEIAPIAPVDLRQVAEPGHAGHRRGNHGARNHRYPRPPGRVHPPPQG